LTGELGDFVGAGDFVGTFGRTTGAFVGNLVFGLSVGGGGGPPFVHQSPEQEFTQ